MDKTDVKKYGEIASFIKENAKQTSDAPENNKYQVSQETYLKYMSDQGITKDTLKKVSVATSDYYNGAISAAKDLMLAGGADIKQVSINTRTPEGVMSTRFKQQIDTRKPTTGEAFVKYGVASVKWDVRSKFSKDLIMDAAKEIEKMCNK